jgi:hypothetical protein
MGHFAQVFRSSEDRFGKLKAISGRTNAQFQTFAAILNLRAILAQQGS